MPATMERDLFSSAADFLSEHFQDRLSEADKLSLEHWMTSRLETERKGWKSSLQKSLQEVEKERKRAMDIDVKIEEFNQKAMNYMSDLKITREPSMYHGADRDMKLLNITELERNMDTILKSVKGIFNERMQCFQLLGSRPEDGKSLDTHVSDLLTRLQEEECTPGVSYKDQVLKLNREIEHLLENQEKNGAQIKEKDSKHLKEIDALTQIITRQRDELDALKGKETSNKETQVYFTPSLRSCGVQVKIDQDSHANNNSHPNSFVGTDSNKHFPSPIKSITITKSQDFESGKKRRWTVHNQEFGRAYSSSSSTPIKRSEHFEEVHSSPFSANSGLHSTSMITGNKLRGEVVEFAEKLEKAKEEVELYQRQLAWMKSIPHAALIHQEIANIRSAYTNVKYQDGYLSGTRKDILPALFKSPDVAILRSQLRSKAKKYGPGGASNSTSRCLKCYNIFKVRENHRKACRYHPRGKKKVEKYDTNGKLETVTYLWECCLQSSDAFGCTSGEHV